MRKVAFAGALLLFACGTVHSQSLNLQLEKFIREHHVPAGVSDFKPVFYMPPVN
ncbi:MAG: hypothetical protein M1469_11450 [Bacteroidetes bacterium]|nr:hypothetical protein [Bacteroidota bacterium]